MKVKAKFKCNSITNYKGQQSVNMHAVCGNSGENADFTKYTPCGNLDISIMEDCPAYNQFIPGEDYYLTFEKSE